MLNHCLTASKRSRNCCNTALCNWEKGIYHTLSCNQRHIKRKFFLIRTSFTNRPFLHHSQFFVAIFCLYNSHYLIYRKVTGFNIFNCSLYSIRNHNFLLYYNCFLNCSDYIAWLHFIARLYHRLEGPFFISF